MRYYFYLFFFFLVIAGCSPKTSKKIKEEVTAPTPTVKKKKANPDCILLDDLTPSESEEAKVNYVLYRDLVKAKKYTEALPFFRKAYGAAPGGNGRIKYQFEDGLRIYKYLYDNASAGEKKAISDTIMSIYDKRVSCFPKDEDYISGRKAFDYYYYYRDHISDDALFDLFKGVVDKKGKKTDYFVVNPFAKMVFDKTVDKTLPITEGRKYAMKIFEIVDYGKKNCKKDDCEAWAIVEDYAPDLLENLEGVDDFYGCDYYSGKYYPRYEQNPKECESIQLALIRMKRGKCAPDDPRMKELESAYANNCRRQVQTQKSGASKGGYACYTDGDFKCAVEKFEKFANETTDMEKKAKTYMLISKIYYRDLKNFNQSRKFALKAAKAKPNWGDPYMLIGKLYASSGPLCGSGRGFKSQVVTWVAIDKFAYAKKIDSSVSAEANKLIANYRRFMPSKADIFQRRLKAGGTFKVGCWIQENTRIRTAD